ncbi:MAG: hypothetical protein PUC98_06540 [Clostridiales bacterium]|nr:hypothetical protein [Clostridiales bacterium]
MAAASGDINTPAKMVLYSAYTHCYSGIKKYFYSNPGKITGTLDLTGYSYYPAEIDTTIENATVTFDYKGLEANPLEPSVRNDQNYGMHTGIFTEVAVASDAVAPKTLNVSGLTISGTVGNYCPDGSGTAGISGALIRGDAHGGNTNAKLNIEISGVTLSNLLIYPRIDTSSEGAADAAVPLLINSIGAYTNLNISGVKMDSYTYGTGASGNLIIGNGYYAATSLIGNVGSENASHIQLVFSDMVLDGTPSKTIFSHALFLESFMYSGDSSGVYNFNNSNDKSYTLGRELSNTDRTGDTAGPSGRNNGLQYHFFDDGINVCTVIGGDTADPESFFNNYTRYVYRQEGGQPYWHELDINLSRTGLIQGCGTINDPYIIGSSIQLRELANILSTNIALKGMQIQVDTGVLSGTALNGFKSSHDAGDMSKHIIYTGDTNWKDTGSGSVSAADMKLYLRNAYYRLEKNIEISGEWTGLGASADRAFCGVIDGNGNTITIKSASSPQFGGVIKFSMGSVVKNLTVHYAYTPAVTSDDIPSDTSKASFFGGIVGWCIGGDTILQDVSVTGLSVPDISGTYPNLASVGGYVGMVGGALIGSALEYGGGVVFRGTVGAGLSGGKASSDSNYFYVNPYVGRVLDGYAMSETTSLDNTDKNYSIPVISAGKHINRTDNVITVNDAQGLWLLSAIANSGAGAIQNSSCKAYTYGKIRTGNYSAIDNAAKNVDEAYIGGKEYTGKTESYLSRYAEDVYDICGLNGGISISLAADSNMTAYGNGFRGIGTSYGTNANTNVNYRLLNITSVGSSAAGTSRTITLNQNKNEYLEEKDSWTSIGTGMFVLMGVPSGGSLTVSDLTFNGKTGIVYYKTDSSSNVKAADVSDLNLGKKKTGTSNGERLTLVGAGMLTGNFAKTGTISKVTCSNVHVSGTESSKVYINKDSQGTTFAGGLIGALWNNGTITDVDVTNCSVKYTDVCGRLDTGGLLGLIKSTNASVTASASDSTSEAPNGYMILQNVNAVSTQLLMTDMTGVGGLIGYSENCTLRIGNNIPLNIKNINVSSKHVKTENDYFNAGGLVGAWVVTSDKDAGYAKKINMQGNIVISGSGNNQSVSSVGAITGALYDSYYNSNGVEKTGNWDGKSKKTHLEISDTMIATDENSSMTICNGRQIGGLIGMLKAGHLSEYNTVKYNETVKIENIRIGHAPSSDGVYNIKLISNSEPEKKDCSVGGVFGTVCINPIIVMNNIEMNGIAAMTHGERLSSAALLIAFTECHSGTAKFKFSNITANKCAAVGDHDNVNAAMIVGRFSDKNKHEVTGNNILFNDCKVGLSLTSNGNQLVLKKLNNSDSVPELDAVGIGNKVGSNYISYNNISVDQKKSINKANMGALFGTVSANRKIQIAGISVQNSSAPLRDYGINSPNSASYIIYADYEGDSLNVHATGSESFFTAGRYVTTRPVSAIGTLEGTAITGDGAAFSSETGQETESVLKKILDDTDGRYYNIQDKSKAFLTAKIGANTATLSSFKHSDLNTFETIAEGASAGSVSGPADFPVVVLQTNSSSVVNSCLYSIISVLTNKELCTDTNGAVTSGTLGFESITATSYKWSDTKGAFEEQVKESGSYPNPSLNVSGNTFYLKPGGYDNKLKQFTLVDVAYKDPSGTENVYHLYIPVVIKKMFDFKFWASAKLGTDYNVKNQYDELSVPVVASRGENVTVLLTYEYQWSIAEWEDAMKNGQNLLWNFDLGVVFDPYSLPSGTKMTLIDRNHGDRAYFFESTKDVNSVSFNDFRTVLGGGTGWKEGRYLCDDLKLTASGPKDSGAYCRLVSDKSKATLRDIEGYYYRPAQSTDSTDSRYDLNITRDNGSSSDGDDNDYKVTARFFLTLQTPASDSGGIVNTNIQCSDILQGNLPTRRLPAEEQTGTGEQKREFSKNGSENKVIIGDFFTQETTVTTTRGEEKMTETNEDIPLELTTAISFKDATAEENYRAYASNQRLYQKFVIRLHEYKNGSSGQKDLAQGTFIRVQHYLGDKPLGDPVTEMLTSSEPYYTIEYRWTDGEPGIPAGSVANGMRLKTNVTLTYLPAVRTEQFPIRSSESSNDGIAVAASSSIAYNLDSLRNGHNSSIDIEAACGQMVPHFYREDTGTASLYYAAYEDTDTVPAESVSRLGINGKDGTEFEIDSMAIYNVSNVKEAVDADKLEVTVTLLQKQSGSTYDSLIYTDITEPEAPPPNTLPEYLSEIAAGPGTLFDVKASYRPKGQGSMQQAALSEIGINTFSFDVSGFDPAVPIQIPVKLRVKTGDSFSGIYANYRVRITAQLKKGDAEIGNSVATDYIVYTNAMISRSFIDIPAESDGGNGTQ